MATIPAPRPGLAPLLALAAMLVLIAAPLSAQAPAMDRETQKSWGKNVITRFAEYYTMAKGYRDSMYDKALEMRQQTRRVIARRQKYESMAVGQLGVLGEEVPDWKEMVNLCAIEVSGGDLCAEGRTLAMRYESKLRNYFDEYTSDIFRVREDIERTIGEFVGGQFRQGEEAVAARFDGSAFQRLALGREGERRQAGMAAELEGLSMTLNSVLDSLYAEDLEGQEISSGRARQIAAYLAVMEAEAEIEIFRQRNLSLDVAAHSAAGELHGMRTGISSRAASLRW